MPTAYYNEFDKKKCAALRALIEDGFITKGDVDDRPIQEVTPKDLQGYDRCHFFAGIGLWDYALNLAGWEGQAWTGSCPCQPFSTAGRQKGQNDDRHLWPVWVRLIQQCHPTTVFGEQVASAVAKGWLDGVYEGMETEGYAVGSAVLPACSVGAPHRRDRLWFVASNDRCKRVQGCRKIEIQGEPAFSWCQNVRGIEDLRNRSDLPKPLIRHLNDGDTEAVGIMHAAGDAIVPQVAAEFITCAAEALS